VARDSVQAIRDSVVAVRDSVRTAARCEGQTITQIDVRPQPPDFGGIVARSRFLSRTIETLHATTQPDVIRRFLVVEAGRPCTELRRAESERILRAQPFLADAKISVYRDRGGVRLDVYTVDETSFLGGLAVGGGAPRPTVLKLGNQNIVGRGIYADAEWRDGFFYRDTYGAGFRHNQLFGRPYQLSAEGVRRSFGGDWRIEAGHAFLTDLQRVAWRVSAGGTEDLVYFARPDGPNPAVSYSRDFADVGGIIRIGVPGQLSLFGLSFSQEKEAAGALPVVVTDTGVVPLPDPDSALLRYRGHRAARVNALWGVRNIAFMSATGFDALSAAQDVRVGIQFGTLFGRSLSILGSEDDDILIATDLYAGYGSPRAFAMLEVRGSGREDGNTNRWDGILASGSAAWYLKPTPSHTVIARAEYGAGWRQRLPFQLTLGDTRGGVRGYRRSQIGGGQRVVGRLEERWFVGRPRGLGDLGLAVFSDVGKIWAGDVPFGVDTRYKVGVGVGVLAAVPPRSQRLYRVDIAFPLSPDRQARWELRVSTGGVRGGFGTEPGDVVRSRERTVPSSIFTWP
jgi:hypothetical protein